MKSKNGHSSKHVQHASPAARKKPAAKLKSADFEAEDLADEKTVDEVAPPLSWPNQGRPHSPLIRSSVGEVEALLQVSDDEAARLREMLQPKVIQVAPSLWSAVVRGHGPGLPNFEQVIAELRARGHVVSYCRVADEHAAVVVDHLEGDE